MIRGGSMYLTVHGEEAGPDLRRSSTDTFFRA